MLLTKQTTIDLNVRTFDFYRIGLAIIYFQDNRPNKKYILMGGIIRLKEL